MKAAEALPLIEAQKSISGWAGFQARDNHAGHLIGSAQLIDLNGVYIPGLTLDIEVKQAAVSAQCMFQFSIRYRRGKMREIVYQLEVVPLAKLSHNGPLKIYGPHEHVGNEDEPTPVLQTDVNCGNWNGCIAWFANRVCVAGLEVENPC
ncbi:hypothetical protein EJD96_15900 [Herbaspirillum seropedicae]|uniref:hypothetical protein n=1 Tax=Herbaspirillum seropedicae TaxID=964 RepID=UPI00111F705C|nr:hypothetical protein [Herbaspirillum seropedicae]QDD65536.1 hypothetical protein EJD96_15900 [Herbaspirillum seropedicae]